MRTIVLNAGRFTDKEHAHAYLKQRLKLPEYYGNNLDALYDVLSSIGVQTKILVLRADRATDYGQKVIETMQDAANENAKLEVRLL